MQAIFQFLVACFFKFGPLYTCFEGICCFFSGIKNADVSNLISNIPLTVVSIHFALQRQSVWLLVKTKRFLVTPETGKTKVREQQVCCLRSGALPPSQIEFCACVLSRRERLSLHLGMNKLPLGPIITITLALSLGLTLI